MQPETGTYPSSDFASLGLSDASLRVLAELGLTEPTPVQASALPVLLGGADLVAQAPTGSGKTLAFGLPLLERLDLGQRQVQAVVLCPTRELAAQVGQTIRTAGRQRPGLRVLVVAGGLPSRPQRQALQTGVHMVVGTPGRILALMAHELDLGAVKLVVLDEADRMLDMGFLPSVQEILKALPKDRQTAVFSATMPAPIAALSRTWQRSPVSIKGSQSAQERPQIQQLAHQVAPTNRLPALRAVLTGPWLPKQGNALVFCNFKSSVDAVADDLNRHGMEAEGLHGDLEQRDRNRVLAKFRNGSTRILVATDVAARGLDIAGIDLVVQYELPQKAEVYVHRIGRTGRAGASGVAIALVTAGEAERLNQGVAASGGEIKHQLLPKAGQGAAEDTPAPAPTETLVTVLIRGGRRDKLRAGDIVGALTGDAGCTAAQVGRIEVQEDGVFVAVEEGSARRLLRAGRLRIKGRTFRVEVA